MPTVTKVMMYGLAWLALLHQPLVRTHLLWLMHRWKQSVCIDLMRHVTSSLPHCLSALRMQCHMSTQTEVLPAVSAVAVVRPAASDAVTSLDDAFRLSARCMIGMIQ